MITSRRISTLGERTFTRASVLMTVALSKSKAEFQRGIVADCSNGRWPTAMN
jgi:hypothetical protein